MEIFSSPLATAPFSRVAAEREATPVREDVVRTAVQEPVRESAQEPVRSAVQEPIRTAVQEPVNVAAQEPVQAAVVHAAEPTPAETTEVVRTDTLELSAHAPEPEYVDATLLSYRRAERTSLFIETQDGDVVRLAFHTRESFAMKGGSEGMAAEGAETMRSTSSSKLSMQVEGQLSAEEFAAIQDAFSQATALAEEFFAGSVMSAFEGASALSIDGGQLASVVLRATMQERLTYAPASFLSLPPVADTVATEVEPEGEADASSSDAADGLEQAVAGPVDAALVASEPEAAGADDVSAAVEPAIEPVDASDVSSDDAASDDASGTVASDTFDPLEVIGDFLSRLSERFGMAVSQNGVQLDFSIKVRMFESALVTLADADASASSLPSLVPETLEAMVAPEKPPLDAVA